jgi:hypothetical protein
MREIAFGRILSLAKSCCLIDWNERARGRADREDDHSVNKGAKINPNMFFFEDINLGADGGLYPELVKNRAFEFTNGMMGMEPDRAGRRRHDGHSGQRPAQHGESALFARAVRRDRPLWRVERRFPRHGHPRGRQV